MTRQRSMRRVGIIGASLAIVAIGLVGGARAARAAPRVIGGPGYWLVSGYGVSFGFKVPSFPSPGATGSDICVGGTTHNYSCIAIAAASTGEGYWMASSVGPPGQPITGYIGDLNHQGTVAMPTGGCGNTVVFGLNNPVVGVAGAAVGGWLVASDGGIFALCGAPYFGSMGGFHLNQPIVGMAATPDGQGYWEVAADGGIFSFGDAHFFGSMGGFHLNQPIVGMAATPDGQGYWEVAADGGIFSFGDAQFHGSMGGKPLNAPMIGMAANPDGTGYWTAASDGGVFSFGDAPFLGSEPGQPPEAPIVGIASTARAS